MRYFVGLMLVLLMGTTYSQSTEEAAVTAVIDRLFTGMATADSAMVRAVFAKEITMATAFRNNDGQPVLRRENTIEDFVVSIGKTQPGVLAEEIWNVKVQLDGDFAQAWCDYAFYVNHKFSHCGVDAFHLHKGTDGWKIFHLADTRRKEGCSIPAEVQKKHQQ